LPVDALSAYIIIKLTFKLSFCRAFGNFLNTLKHHLELEHHPLPANQLATSDIRYVEPVSLFNMPPKQQRIVVQSSRRAAPKGFFSKAYYELTSSENASVVRSVAIFGVRKLLPPGSP
jgi:hypothetical protein